MEKKVHFKKVMQKDGELYADGLPYKKGEIINVVLLNESNKETNNKKYLTANDLLNSNLIGLWKNRKDITNSKNFARKLRNKSQRRYNQ